MITLRQLRYLVSLARHRHFGRAAEDCAVTQPALSMQIRELEREIGADLVERRPNDIALTDTGVEIAERAEQILAATRDLVDFARHRDILAGSLKLGVIPTLAPYLLPLVLPLLQQRYPALRLDVRETQTQTLVEELVAGALDCLLLALPVEAGDVETLPLFDDRFLLAAPAAEPLPKRRVTVADVEVRDARVKLSRFAKPEPGRTIGLAWRRTSPRRKDFEALAEILREAQRAAK
jgi:LysR family hydrogen peroxide-inducible transcriptional activator